MTKKEQLEALKEKMAKADLPLKKGATQLVFGSGNPEAELFFLGEGPGFWEDQKGIPFVGNAGALLNRMLAAINIPREHVFITNVVCYRPPENRDPEPEEIAAFQPFIDQIIEIIAPKVIITLGRFSMAKFIPGVMITNIHGKPHVVDWQAKKMLIVPMYHPAAALRNGEIMRRLRDDFNTLPNILSSRDDLIQKSLPKEENPPKPPSQQMGLI